jgi:hypothetical protein
VVNANQTQDRLVKAMLVFFCAALSIFAFVQTSLMVTCARTAQQLYGTVIDSRPRLHGGRLRGDDGCAGDEVHKSLNNNRRLSGRLLFISPEI